MSPPTTRAQREAVARKFAQDPDGSPTYRAFRARARPGFDGVLMLQWCGMWLGIERDGYTHS